MVAGVGPRNPIAGVTDPSLSFQTSFLASISVSWLPSIPAAAPLLP